VNRIAPGPKATGTPGIFETLMPVAPRLLVLQVLPTAPEKEYVPPVALTSIVSAKAVEAPNNMIARATTTIAFKLLFFKLLLLSARFS
jgi:hypothetical protein